MQYQIPKRIVQTGKHVDLALRTKAMVASIRAMNPDYEYLFFDNHDVERFIDLEFPRYRKVFDSFRFPIQKYDFFRYLAIYRYGGFYFDLDVILASDLSSLLAYECVFPFEGLTFSRLLRSRYGMDWEIGNFAFGAAAGHPFLEAVVENCVRASMDPNWVKAMMRGLPLLSRTDRWVLNTTGPGLISRTLAERPDLADAVTVLFPDNVCDLKNWNRFGEFGVHLMEASWHTRMNPALRRLKTYLEYRKVKALIKESERLGTVRSHPRGNASGQAIARGT